MKYILAIIGLITLGLISQWGWNTLAHQRDEKVESAIEQSLFPVITKSQTPDHVFARPMWTDTSGDALTVYCDYYGDKSPEAREQVRNEMVLVVKKWAETHPRKFKFHFVTFTDEVIGPEKK